MKIIFEVLVSSFNHTVICFANYYHLRSYDSLTRFNREMLRSLKNANGLSNNMVITIIYNMTGTQ